MSKEGSLARIAKYKRIKRDDLLADEEEFYKKNYEVVEAKPVEKKSKVNKEQFSTYYMEFTAKDIDGELVINPIIEKSEGNVTVHVPSFKIIEKLKIDMGKPDFHRTDIVKLKKENN